MTFIERIESLSARFLSDRTYELIVAPAIADVQHDAAGADAPPSPDRGHFSVLRAFVGAVYEDLTADSALTVAGLALIPAAYYAFMLFLVVPDVATFVAANSGRLALVAAIAALSFGPVLACCWPERTRRRAIQPDVADA